jgi:hypothetical protein
LPTCCEQRVTYLVMGISDLELESMFLEHESLEDLVDTLRVKCPENEDLLLHIKNAVRAFDLLSSESR